MKLMSRPSAPPFVTALRFRFLTPAYDRILEVAIGDRNIKRALVEQAGVENGARVLDVGCGTGTMTRMIRERCPDARVVGLDADEEVLAIARRKAADSRANIDFVHGFAEELDVGHGSFDVVVSCLFFHHLSRDGKMEVLRRIRAVLRSGGTLHVADWGRPQGTLAHLGFLGVRLLDGLDRTRDHATGRFCVFLGAAGFQSVRRQGSIHTAFGTVEYWRARK
jgi:ubiquinone/menaquinone biosynthesis C-methylase UbiE